ncbi:hypothetical protein GGX14DRAFT_408120 [Mycena pura]|uniref:Uncharacterized protein n=1 Tax=Mycena pura TaxID=153505 RepID=A0AAD6UQX4_9AGAR|nr:hypothetical protein GGX14DRAFT_408120 [Mycena pura]
MADFAAPVTPTVVLREWDPRAKNDELGQNIRKYIRTELFAKFFEDKNNGTLESSGLTPKKYIDENSKFKTIKRCSLSAKFYHQCNNKSGYKERKQSSSTIAAASETPESKLGRIRSKTVVDMFKTDEEHKSTAGSRPLADGVPAPDFLPSETTQQKAEADELRDYYTYALVPEKGEVPDYKLEPPDDKQQEGVGKEGDDGEGEGEKGEGGEDKGEKSDDVKVKGEKGDDDKGEGEKGDNDKPNEQPGSRQRLEFSSAHVPELTEDEGDEPREGGEGPPPGPSGGRGRGSSRGVRGARGGGSRERGGARGRGRKPKDAAAAPEDAADDEEQKSGDEDDSVKAPPQKKSIRKSSKNKTTAPNKAKSSAGPKQATKSAVKRGTKRARVVDDEDESEEPPAKKKAAKKGGKCPRDNEASGKTSFDNLGEIWFPSARLWE